MSLLSHEALQSSDQLARQFQSAQPFRHVVIDGFFAPTFCQRILDDFPPFEDRFALNEAGVVGGKAVRMGVRALSPAYAELDDFLQTREFLDYVSRITGIADLLYDSDYVGGGTHENRDGQSLDAHVDFNYHPHTKAHRRLNLIVYMNHEWAESWGGALELQSDPWHPTNSSRKSVLPLFNRAVIFETNEVSWHGFDEIRLPQDKKSISRKSFAIYLYTKARPAAETAPEHATVYVPAGIPTDLVAGRTLTDSDVTLLSQRFTRMRGQLYFLYEREKRDNAQREIIEKALSESRDAWRVPLQGFAKQPEAPRGIFQDGWVSPRFAMSFTPSKPIRGISLDVWAPGQLSEHQSLQLEVDGERWTHPILRGTRSLIEMKLKRPANRIVNLRIDASQHFVPAISGDSSDDRALAWMLREASLIH